MSRSITRIGEKGQITIPAEFREKEGIKKGDLLEVVDIGEGNILITKMTKKQEFLIAMKFLGRKLLEKKYDTDEKIITLSKEIRKEVYNESIGRH